MALDMLQLPADMTEDKFAAAAVAAPDYSTLVAAITQALAAGQSPTEDSQVIDSTRSVAKQLIVPLGSAASGTAARVLASAPTPVTTPLPFYLIKSFEPFNRVSIDDIQGGNAVNIQNQTFITWAVTTTSISGNSIETTLSKPLETTTLQLIGYYGSSASKTMIQGSSPEFTLTLYQNRTTKTQNTIAAFIKYIFFIYSATTGLYPNKQTSDCVVEVASSIFNDQFPELVTHPDAATASAYFSKLLPISATGDAAYKKFSKCGVLPSPTQLFGAMVGRIWKYLNLFRSGVSMVGAAAETFTYWDFNSPYQVCKSNGAIVNCDTIAVTKTACVKVKAVSDSSTAGGYTGPRYDITASGNGTGNDPSAVMLFRINAPSSCYGCDGAIPRISCSDGWTAKLDGITFSCVRTAGAPSTFSFSFVGSLNMNPIPQFAGIPQSVQACVGQICTTQPLACPG